MIERIRTSTHNVPPFCDSLYRQASLPERISRAGVLPVTGGKRFDYVFCSDQGIKCFGDSRAYREARAQSAMRRTPLSSLRAMRSAMQRMLLSSLWAAIRHPTRMRSENSSMTTAILTVSTFERSSKRSLNTTLATTTAKRIIWRANTSLAGQVDMGLTWRSTPPATRMVGTAKFTATKDSSLLGSGAGSNAGPWTF